MVDGKIEVTSALVPFFGTSSGSSAAPEEAGASGRLGSPADLVPPSPSHRRDRDGGRGDSLSSPTPPERSADARHDNDHPFDIALAQTGTRSDDFVTL